MTSSALPIELKHIIHYVSTLFRCAPKQAYSTTSSLHRSAPGARRHIVSEGRTTRPSWSQLPELPRRSPWYFETGYSIFAKRATRPFPPPFISYPSGSYSDPLTTHQRPDHRHPKVDGELLRGITNGDDAILIDGRNFLVVNDGVGAWAQKERGHAALWSRLIAHYWAAELEKHFCTLSPDNTTPITLDQISPVACLDTAYARSNTATHRGTDSEIQGTTTASSALLHHNPAGAPVVLATTLGDCAILILRPATQETLYKSVEQWHWFDCPRQLGTNSPDTPTGNAICDTVPVQEGDLVLCLSDGVTDNLWEEELVEKSCEAMQLWTENADGADDGVVFVARRLMEAARDVAMDPSAGSPYMERAIEEGLAAEGGKLDDISVVVGVVRKAEE